VRLGAPFSLHAPADAGATLSRCNSTGDLESLSYTQSKGAFRGGAPYHRCVALQRARTVAHAHVLTLPRSACCSLEQGLDPALLFDASLRGDGAFSVAEGDESGCDAYDVEAPSTGGQGRGGLFALQRPGVPMQRGSATTRQRTPTTRHAPPPTTQAAGSGVRRPAGGAPPAFAAQSAGNASSAALMPPPPPRATPRSLPSAHAAQGVPSSAAAPLPAHFRRVCERCRCRRCAWRMCADATSAPLPRPPEPQTRAASGRRTASTTASTRPMLRRVQSTGDLHAYNLHAALRSPMHAVMEGRLLPEGTQDDGIYRIGKYTLEERRMRILRYRQKRHERNFERKIKYSCRKTLADSRPRVRGRFAKVRRRRLRECMHARMRAATLMAPRCLCACALADAY
jgi:hypothetical protein